ncbi:DNA mismatch repair protein MutT [Bacillus sp. BB51/4]|nr:DNA mismatch repair protein MutT [Bacillus sp. BB51/4]TCD33293.1 DNA mismatch repair protein MutT [Bacillus wiedmannii]
MIEIRLLVFLMTYFFPLYIEVSIKNIIQLISENTVIH